MYRENFSFLYRVLLLMLLLVLLLLFLSEVIQHISKSEDLRCCNYVIMLMLINTKEANIKSIEAKVGRNSYNVFSFGPRFRGPGGLSVILSTLQHGWDYTMLRCCEAPPMMVIHLWINSSSNFRQPPFATSMRKKSNNYHTVLNLECYRSDSVRNQLGICH